MNTQRSNGARAEKTVACDRPAKRGAGRRPATPAAVARTSATASVRSPRLCVSVFVCDLRLLQS
jgi:hypothetical protein